MKEGLNACCRALADPETCEHRERYLQAVAYVESQGIPVGYAPDGAREEAWKAGLGHFEPASIDMWPSAYEIYGWDMVTSVLIHEFGHCKLYEAERIYEGIEAERKADEYGYRHMPRRLIPLLYEEHCAFFFQSNEVPGGWTARSQVIEALDLWRSRLNQESGGQESGGRADLRSVFLKRLLENTPSIPVR